MRAWKKLGVIVMLVAVGAMLAWAAESKEELTKKLWPKERVEKALKRIGEVRKQGLMTEERHEQTKKMLEARLAGRYKPEMLSDTNPPLNFVKNAVFEYINKNSRPNRSRWLWWSGWAFGEYTPWWGGWSWGGDYENKWEDRKEHVHSGTYSARVTCKGKKGRIGISTARLPMVPGVTGYEFSIWAKGTPGNQVFINFEAGARGSYRGEVPGEWTRVTVKGTPQPDAKQYMVYTYVTGTGTVWLDDAKLVPLGADVKD